MAIFNVDVNPDPPAVKEAKRLMIQGNEDFNYLVTVHINSFRDLWFNESGLSPDDIVAGFGAQGTKVMQMAWGRVQYLLSIDPTCLQPEQYTPPRAIIYNQDGSVSLEPESN